jgi:hypothetical protein
MTAPRPDRPYVLRWRSAVINAPGVRSTTKLLLLALAEFADTDGGNCYPTIAALEYVTKMGDRAIRRALAAAETAGWLSRAHSGRQRRGQGWKAYEYTLLLPEGADIRTARQLASELHKGPDKATAPPNGTCGLSVPNARTTGTQGPDTATAEVGKQLAHELGGPSSSSSSPEISQGATARQPDPNGPRDDDDEERPVPFEDQLPAWVPVPTWREFFQHRSEIGKPLSAGSIGHVVRRLGELRAQGHDLVASLEQTMGAGLALPVTPINRDLQAPHAQSKTMAGRFLD